jgi:hypothetical protein
VPHTTLSPTASVPHTTLSQVALAHSVPQTTLSPGESVPHTTLSHTASLHIVPHAIVVLSAGVGAAPQITPVRHAVAVGLMYPPDNR